MHNCVLQASKSSALLGQKRGHVSTSSVSNVLGAMVGQVQRGINLGSSSISRRYSTAARPALTHGMLSMPRPKQPQQDMAQQTKRPGSGCIAVRAVGPAPLLEKAMVASARLSPADADSLCACKPASTAPK